MSSRTILLAEDNPQDEALTLRALRKVNVANRIEVVRDGVEALDYLFCRGDFQDRNPQGLPTVVLLDLKLPKLDGTEVLSQIRRHPLTRLLPVVILTSSDEERDILRCYQNGANSYVQKPLDFTEYSQAVAELGVYWMTLNKLS